MLASRLDELAHSELAVQTTSEAIGNLPALSGDTRAAGVAMAVRAAGDQEDHETIAASFVALVEDLLHSLR
jgi:hypothetical protein